MPYFSVMYLAIAGAPTYLISPALRFIPTHLPTPLLIAPEAEHDSPLGLEVGRLEQMLDRDHDGNQAALGIAGASTPNIRPVIVTRIGRLVPLREGRGEDGDDVLVRGEEERFEREVGAG